MDDAKKIIDEASREGLHMSQGLLKLVLKMWESAREDVQAATAAARRLRLVAVLAAVLAAVCLCVCVYQGTVIQRQGGELAAIHRILEEGVVIERHKRREELPHLRKTPMSSRHIEERRRVESVTSQQRLMDAINGTVLKPRERQVLLLKIFDDLSHNEIADRLNITEKTSQRLFSKAIRKIQDAL